MADTTMTRVSEKQLERLKAMAESNNLSARDFLDRLIDKAYKSGEIISVINGGPDKLIDQEFDRRVKQFPVVAVTEGVE